MSETAVFSVTSSVSVNEMAPTEPFGNYNQGNHLKSDKVTGIHSFFDVTVTASNMRKLSRLYVNVQ